MSADVGSGTAWEAALHLARIPRRYWDCRWSEMRDRLARQDWIAVRDWLDGFLGPDGEPSRELEGWFVYGGLGAGKTLFACDLAMHVLEKEHIALIRRRRDLRPRVGFWAWGWALKSLLEPCLERDRRRFWSDVRVADLLVVDNVGADCSLDSGWERDQLELVLRKRAYDRRPLVITSNVAPEGVEGRYGDAVASLVVGYYRAVEVGGDDYRKLMLAKADRASLNRGLEK